MNKGGRRKPLLFSGYNQRSVITLCRYLRSRGIDFCVVSSGPGDPIHETSYSKNVIFCRAGSALTLGLFDDIRSLGPGGWVYCPTSEYLNRFVLSNSRAIEDLNILTGMPAEETYETLSDKGLSVELMRECSSVRLVESISLSEAVAPCVVKPYKNVVAGRTLYPILCYSDNDLERTRRQVDGTRYFAQRFIEGQSYYLCGYIKKDMSYNLMWQENLLQQPGGKSIVLARSCENPGINEGELVARVAKAGYFGPLMVEFIKKEDDLYFIEINPRFWGPLQLVADKSPEILDGWAEEWLGGGAAKGESGGNEMHTCYYAWYKGAQAGSLRVYPACNDSVGIDSLLREYDVYNREDTKRLHGVF